MNWSSVISNAGAVLGILGLAAFAFAYFKSDVTKKTVEQLKELAEALEMRVNNLESEREQMLESIHKLEQENEVLRSLLDGKEESADIQAKIDDYHKELLLLFGKTIEKIEQLTNR